MVSSNLSKNCTDPFGEDVSLLYPDNNGDKFARFTDLPIETPIIKGVVNQLRKWPADLFFAFLAACLIIGSVVFLIFVTVAICVPTVVGNRCPRKRLSYAKRNVLVERQFESKFF